MKLLPDILHSFGTELLKKPGDKFVAEITKSGKEVIKLRTSEITKSAVRYPSTGTIVETIVQKKK